MPQSPRASAANASALVTTRQAIGFAALVLILGSGWLLDAVLPAALPGSLSLCVNGTLSALLLFAVSRKLPPCSRALLGYSTLLFAVPTVLASLASGHLSSTTIVLAYTLVPAATVFFAAQEGASDFLGLLGPALAGVAGAALILPFALPSSLAGQLYLGAVLLSALGAALAGLRLHTLLARAPILPASAVASCGIALAGLLLYALERPNPVLLTWPQVLLSESIHLAFRAATMLLSVWLLRDLRPVAFSARYLLIPLVTIAEGYFLLHPIAPWTLPTGALLLAGSSALLVGTRDAS